MSVDFFKLRAGSEFKVSENLKHFSINEVWKNNEALWNLISAMADEPGAVFYERSIDLVKNIADVDICDVKHLESLSYQMGINSGFGFIDALPTEIYNLINVLSIKPSYLLEGDNVFSVDGVNQLYEEINNNISNAVADVCAVYGEEVANVCAMNLSATISGYANVCSGLTVDALDYVRSNGIKVIPMIDNGDASAVYHVASGSIDILNHFINISPEVAKVSSCLGELTENDFLIENQYNSMVANDGYYVGDEHSILNLFTNDPVYAVYSKTACGETISANTWYFFKSLSGNLGTITPNRATFEYNVIADVNDYLTLKMPLVVELPVRNQIGDPVPDASIIGLKNDINIDEKFVGNANYVKWFIKDIYKNAIMSHLTCERNFGNESIVDYYKEKFSPFVGEYGFQQMLNSGNVNYQFYRGLVFSNFCANLTSLDDYSADWFLDFDPNDRDPDSENGYWKLNEVAEDVAKSMADFTFAIMVRRDLLKKLSYRYAQIGSNDNLEKTVRSYIARNYTKRDNDWQMLSNVAVSNDVFLPTLNDLAETFNVEVTEYYDNTDYLNISAESAKKTESYYEIDSVPSATINASGNIASTYVPVRKIKYRETEELAVSGGNERFWETDSYHYQLNSISNDVVEFYQNVEGSMIEDFISVSSLMDDVYSKYALSSLFPFSEPMHRKYIGSDDSYFKAVNLGNPDYPTIAPINNLAGLSKLYGNLEREYQSILNDDRPVTVIGVDPTLTPKIERTRLNPEKLNIPGTVTGMYPPDISEEEKDLYKYHVLNDVYREVTIGGYDITSGEISNSAIVDVTSYITASIPSSWEEERTSSEWRQEISIKYANVYDGERVDVGETFIGLLPDYSMSGISIVDDQANPMTGALTGVMMFYEGVSVSPKFDPSSSAVMLDSMIDDYRDNYHDLNGRIDPIGGDYPDRYNDIVSNIGNIDASYIANIAVRSDYDLLMGSGVISGLPASNYDQSATANIYSKDDNGNIIPSTIKTYGELLNYVQAQKNEYANTAANYPPAEGVTATAPDVLAFINDVIQGKVSGADYGTLAGASKERILETLYSTMKSTHDYISLYNTAIESKNYFESVSNDVYLSGTITCFNAFENVVDQTKNFVDQAVIDAEKYENGEKEISGAWNKALSALSQSELVSAFGPLGGSASYPYDPSQVVNNLIPLQVSGFEDSIWREVEVPYTVIVSGNGNVVNTVIEQQVSSWSTPTSISTYVEKVSGGYVKEEMELIGFISSFASANEASIDGIYGMFDGEGGIINSWRNIGVELRGYQSRYEVSPNFNQDYVENRFVDYDGPWIGDALYNLVDQAACAYYNGGSAVTPITSANVLVLRNNFESSNAKDNIDRLTRWWMSDYVNQMGMDLQTQILCYWPDIFACSAQSIFEFDVDSYSNQYTLFKERGLEEPYDASGVLWMRHCNFPLSFPVLNNKFEINGQVLPYVMVGEEQMTIDQLILPSQIASEDRHIMNHCLAFGINNTALYVAGYDNASGHFNINIYSNSYFVRNVMYDYKMTKKKFYGTQSTRSIIRMNDPNGEEIYKWKEFAGGYYDAERIIFVFYRPNGFALRIYGLTSGRLNDGDRMVPFTESNFGENFGPDVNRVNSQLRLVEDVDFFYVGWTKISSPNRLIVCQVNKDTFKMTNYGVWNIPDAVENPEIDKLIAGQHTVKVKFKSGEIFYGPMHQSAFKDLNSGNTDLLSSNEVRMKYIVEELEDTDMKLPIVPVIDITQWQQWGYSLTNNTLYTMSYADAIMTSSINSYNTTPGGHKYGFTTSSLYRPGEYMNQEMVSYQLYSGTGEVDIYGNGRPVPSITGYEIGRNINRLSPGLQQVIHPYGPSYAQTEFRELGDPMEITNLILNSSAMILSSYYGLPYNAVYAERTDNADNNINRNRISIDGRFSRYNYLLLKNFYNYNYNHEYVWSDASSDVYNNAIGWRKYIRCSLSRYSDAMWMSYRYFRDINRYGDTEKKRNIAAIMNNFEWVELVYGMTQLMNSGYSKSNVFSLKINNSTFARITEDAPEGQQESNAAMRKQIAADIREFIGRYIPAQTQLWKVEFND